MINPDIFLALLVPLTAYYLGSCIWRLRQKKPENDAAVFGVVILLFTVLLVTATLHTPDTPLRFAAKAFVVVGNIAAAILRLVARHRFATS